MQYAIAFFPDSTLNVAVVGPYRSLPRAERALERIENAIEYDEADAMNAFRRPQIIPMVSEDQAIDEYGLDPERT